jgi:rSAM/selenodomain-associated transferase 2
MRLAVVVPTLDEAGRIAHCVASAQGPGVDVLVVDAGSRDGTAEKALAAGARVIEAPRGRAAQLEAGLRATRADAVLFLHADTQLPAGWVGAVRDALRDPAVVGGAFAFRFDVRSPRLRFVEWGARLRSALLRLPYGDQALFARRDALLRLGGVPQAPIMEDLDLVVALRRQGRLVLLPLVAVTSARRFLERGPLRVMLRNWLALAAWWLGVDRRRLAAWYGR